VSSYEMLNIKLSNVLNYRKHMWTLR